MQNLNYILYALEGYSKVLGRRPKKQDHRKIFNLNLGVIEMMISELD